jgi:hypothetical protein
MDAHWLEEMRTAANLLHKFVNLQLEREALATAQLSEYVRAFQEQSDGRVENLMSARKLAGCIEAMVEDEFDRAKELSGVILTCSN